MTLYAPRITSPIGGEAFNFGTVSIEWDVSDPPSDDVAIDTSDVTYELEYTTNYQGSETDWHTIKRRIQYSMDSDGKASYTWNVGKMIKSNKVRIRMRSKSATDQEPTSDYAVVSGDFSINVFDLIPPAIVNPVPNVLYTDFVLIILDETLTKNTYHQKVRYTLEYSSEKRSVDWTLIVGNVPVGQNVIRWDVGSLTPSDDYVLRLTASNVSTCDAGISDVPNQFAEQYVYDIRIQQSGSFIIDTKPPDAVLEIENSTRITNQLDQILNVYAEDATTDVEQIQIRECNASSALALGDLTETEEDDGCEDLSSLISGASDFDYLIGKPTGYATKTLWEFDDVSGLRKLEAMLTDSGGNSSLQETIKVFMSVFTNEDVITDFVIRFEQRDKVTVDDSQSPPSIVIESNPFEVVYLSTVTGELWVLEPFPTLVYTISDNLRISKLFQYNGTLYLFVDDDSSLDLGLVYTHNVTEPSLLFTFPNANSGVCAVAEFDGDMYVGLTNGELWVYDGVSFQLVTTFSDPIRTLYGDSIYLYIGFWNDSNLTLYNGTSFFTFDLDA